MWFAIAIGFVAWLLSRAFSGGGADVSEEKPLRAEELLTAAEDTAVLSLVQVTTLAAVLAGEIDAAYPAAAERLREIGTRCVPLAREESKACSTPSGELFRTHARIKALEAKAASGGRARDGCDRLWRLLMLGVVKDSLPWTEAELAGGRSAW